MVIAHTLGFPRIGARRELKWALEDYWAGRIDAGALQAAARELRHRHWDLQRRAGLEKILQWFPNDTETVFEARIWLASLDWTDATNREFADRAAELLGQYAGRISPWLRAWGVYLEAKARWEADKDPAAIDRLEQVADDKTLTAYRRGWAAVFAARYRRETDAAVEPFGE